MQQRNLLLFLVLSTSLLLAYGYYRGRAPQPTSVETAVKKKEEKKDAAVSLPAPPPVTPSDQLLTLGERDRDSRFNLEVKLDPLGGGVRSVALNKFRPADADGRPAQGDDLDLVPADANLQEPSHLLYHFVPGDKDLEPRPLDTLGRRRWKVVERDGQAIVTTQEGGKTKQQVSFQTEIEGVIITKTYTLIEGDYHVGLQVDLERPPTAANAKPSEKEPIKFRYQLTGAKGLPVEGKWYTGTFRNALIALEDDRGNIDRKLQELRQIDLWGGGQPIDREEGKILRYAGVAVQYFASVIVVDENQSNQKFLRRATPSLETGVAQGRLKEKPRGAANYLVVQGDDSKRTLTRIYVPEDLRATVAAIPENLPVAVIYKSLSFDPALEQCPKVALDVRAGLEAQATHALWEDDITVRVATETVTLAPGAKESHRYLLYNGPVKPSLLHYLRGDRAVDSALIDRYAYTLKLNTLTDYHSPGWIGAFASRIYWTALLIKCTNLMHWVLGKLTLLVPSYGLSIIVLTLLVRLFMFPLSRKQAAMSLKMQALQPELKALAAKHKDDRAAYAQAQMALFRKHGVHPLGSCWIVLLQMPIFMGLYFALQESIQFRLAGFFPTWMVNLAAPDMLWEWGRSIPWISRDADYGGILYLGPYLNVLPILAVGLMVVQQKMLMPPPADKEQEMQQKMMRIMMIVMGLFFYKIAAGLCIYIITSTLWGFAERKLLPKAKPVGIDIDTDKRVQTMLADRSTTAVTEQPGRKGGKSKRKAERGRKEAKTGLSGMRQRLSDWWADLLEQARKK